MGGGRYKRPGFCRFMPPSWGVHPAEHIQGNKSVKSDPFCKCCSQLFKKGYEFSKHKRFQIKLIYFNDLSAHLKNYVLLKAY